MQGPLSLPKRSQREVGLCHLATCWRKRPTSSRNLLCTFACKLLSQPLGPRFPCPSVHKRVFSLGRLRQKGAFHLHLFHQGCHGIGSETKDAQSERQESIVDTHDSADGSYSYKIKEGDTLTSIANKFKVPLQSIAIVNEIADIDYVPAGKWLVIPHVCMKTSEASPEIHHPWSLVEDQKGESSSTAQVKGSFSLAPACSASPLFQARHVKLALSFLLLLAVFVLVKKYISGLGPKQHDEHIQCQIEREVEGVHHKTSVKRWQCILDDDRKVNEEEGSLSADGRAAVDTEEENLRQTYAQLESAYAKFLADSGLSKTGYWRGGVPPALEEK